MNAPVPANRISVELPAKGLHRGLLRTMAAQLAASMNYTIEEIDDVKMMTDEAASLLADAAPEHGVIRAVFDLDSEYFQAHLSTSDVTDIDKESFAWTILEAIAEELSVERGESFSISFSKRPLLGRDGA